MTAVKGSRLLFIGVGGVAAAAAWRVLAKLRKSTGGAPQLPIEARREKLAEAVQRFGNMFSKVPVISADEAQKLLQQQPGQYVLVDVRNKEEQEVSMLPGSRTAPEFEQQKEAFRDSTVICYCTVGYRSSQYAASLMDKGQQAFNLQGGIVGWTHAGLPLVNGADRQQSTSRVHTYSHKWACQADGYDPVYYTNSKFVMLRDVLISLKNTLVGG